SAAPARVPLEEILRETHLVCARYVSSGFGLVHEVGRARNEINSHGAPVSEESADRLVEMRKALTPRTPERQQIVRIAKAGMERGEVVREAVTRDSPVPEDPC